MNLSNGERKYLLGVLETLSEYGWTRLKRVSDFFGVKMPTAKEFLGSLAAKGLIEYQRRGSIFLTSEGLKIAKREKKKLETITTFLVKCLLLDEKKARESAIKVLFDLDDEVSSRMYEFIEFMTKCPSRPVFIERFETFVQTGSYEVCDFCPIIFSGGDQLEDKRSEIPGEEDNGSG